MVLKGIDLSVDAGDVLALIGGNGAGKSTLMKIIMGIYTCDEGEVLVDGKAVKLDKPSASLAQGIYLVPQEPMLFPNMTVLENVLMGFNEKEGELKKRLNDCMRELNFDLNLQRKANTLSIAEQQLVELLRGMMRNARILDSRRADQLIDLQRGAVPVQDGGRPEEKGHRHHLYYPPAD